MNRDLYDALRKLDATGYDGFEGLIAKLLESLTERRFFLAKSGYQGGRDINTGDRNANAIAVECKRYKDDTDLDDRQLLGELQQVSWDVPDLDLWVLVTSRQVSAQLATALVRSAREKGFEAFIIDTIESACGSPSSLATLCAHNPDLVLQFLQKKAPKLNTLKLQNILTAITQQSGYHEVFQRLRQEFSSSMIGYENWRHCQNSWLLEKFESDAESRAAFNQSIHILNQPAWIVEREDINKHLDNWLRDSWKKNRKFLALLGEEGDGKTWAIASWLAKNLKPSSDFPPIIFLTSNTVPITTEPQELFAYAIAHQLRDFDAEYWEKRIEHWMQKSPCDTPQIILVLDGVNERYDIDWRSLLEKLTASEWQKQIAIILTCRSIPWEERYASLSHLPIQTLTIQPFNDKELTVALSHQAMTLSDVQSSLLPLIRKPRYLDLVIRHRKVMKESGDITVERLLYEDWRDRISRKSGVTFGHNDFHALIRDLAQKASSGSKAFLKREIESLLPVSEVNKIVQELISGGILVPHPTRTGQYQVQPQRLIHGFGLLLKEEVHEALLSKQPVEEYIVPLLEPHRDMGTRVKIYGAAVVHALMDENYPEAGKNFLFQLWLKGRNLDKEAQESILAYLPCCPETYVQVAEYVWSEAHNNASAQTLLMQCFLKWREIPKLQALLPSVFERWMGFLHPYGFIVQRGRTREESEKLRQKIEEKVGTQQLQPGLLNFQGYDFSVVEDDGLLRLTKVALAIISHGQRLPFIKAFVTWSLSRALMGRPDEYELVSWVLKTTREDIWEPFEAEIEHLAAINHTVTLQAAYRLLSCLDTQEARQFQHTLPDDLFPPHPLQEIYEQDPCTQGFYLWRREDYRNCLQRHDLAPYHIASKMKELSLEPDLPVPSDFGECLKSLVGEDFSPDNFWTSLGQTSADHQLGEVESTLAAFAPDVLADIIRRIIRDAPNRSDVALRQLSLRIKQNLLILGEEERDAVEQTWKRLITNSGNLTKSEKEAEERIFPAVLNSLSANEQLHALLSRPDDALDLVQYKYLFKHLPSKDIEQFLQNPPIINNPRKLQRVLWFLFVNPPTFSSSDIKQITKFLEHHGTETRRFVFELIYKSQNEEAIQYVINSSWSWHPEHWFKEDEWGSLLLSNFGHSLSYQKIRARVHPVYWGYAVEKRGLIETEISQYAEDIHTIWQRIKEKGTALPDDFPPFEIRYSCDQQLPLFGSVGISIDFLSTSFTVGPEFYSSWGGITPSSHPNTALHQDASAQLKERNVILQETLKKQAETGNDWFAKKFYPHALKHILSQRPDLVQIWLQAVYESTEVSSRLLSLCRSFYEALLEILFEEEPHEALKLFHKLRSLVPGIRVIESNTGIQCSDYALFHGTNHPNIQKIWGERLESCSNDLELFELTLVAQQTGNSSWLKGIMQEGLNSPWLFEQAKAIILLGFLEDEENETILRKYCDIPQCWVKEVAQKAFDHYTKNVWAKQWFQRFLENEDNVKAWACFKLFLKCVDRRLWIWEKEFVNEELSHHELLQKRMSFLRLNYNELKNSIQKNEKKRRETLLGEKILKNQVWPWMT